VAASDSTLVLLFYSAYQKPFVFCYLENISGFVFSIVSISLLPDSFDAKYETLKYTRPKE
jgi:hypothetical protein